MKKMLSILLVALLAAGAYGAALATGGDVGQTAKQETNTTAIVLSALFMTGALWITKWTAKHARPTADFYTAGSGIASFRNGLTISDDYMSAVSLLGISTAVITPGYGGLIYSIGFLVGQPVITFLMAERLRSLGKFTFTDVAGYRSEQGPIHSFAAIGTLVVVAFYLIAQIVGAGQLIKLLFGLGYWTAVVIVSVLMMVYVLFDDMTATTWVQIIKACMLLAGVTFMAIMVLAQYSFSLEALFAKAVQIKTAIAANAGRSPDKAARVDLSVMAPGGFIKDPISTTSSGMALMFGTAGLPHILMRFFTVPDIKEVRRLIFWATTWIGYFYILIFIIGFGAITLVLTSPKPSDVAKGVIKGGAGTTNITAVLVAKTVGGNVFYGFISTVAFTMILTVITGLTLSGAPTVSHDLYATIFKHGKTNSVDELKVSRVTTLMLDVIAVLLGIAFEKQNIAFMVSLAFAMAVSVNFPVLFLSMLWKGYATRSVVIGGFLELASSVGLMIVSPSMREATLGYPKGSAWFPYMPPALFSMTIDFVGMWLFSVLDSSVYARNEEASFTAQQVRSETGLGAVGVSDR